jgi:hypothetical protein
MPAEYMHCMETMMKEGKGKDEAQKVCSISYYKRHGHTPQQDEKMMGSALLWMFEEITAAKEKKEKHVGKVSGRNLPESK